jgi:hypothetical protein
MGRRRVHRIRWQGLAVLLAALSMAAACTQAADNSSQGGSTGKLKASSSPSTGHGKKATSSPTPKPPNPANPNAFFTPKKLKPGQKPPQFVVLSFDGVGWDQKWAFWHNIAKKVPLRFTGFLSGLYLIDEAHKDTYKGPGHLRGHSSLGTFNTQAEVLQEINDLNYAWSVGDEIGTHFLGHFCSDNPPGGNDWSTADWNNELDQFFGIVRHYKTDDQLPSAPTLKVPVDAIRGERTPCLEGHPEALYPALRAHNFSYDSSFTRRGLYWPVKQDGIWEMGMPEFPLAGTNHFQITMDYNFWYTQEQVSQTVSPAKSAQDAKQVTQTYTNMYNAAFQGNRAPLILGNHFEAWNNNAYTKALAAFALKTCGKPDTYCVPFRDVVRWMEMQSPATLAHLQALPPELGPPSKKAVG